MAEPKKYNSIDYSQNADDIRSIKSERLKMKLSEDKDKILQKLSQKNEELRKQLKKISEELSEQIKRKKFVPKKKGATADDEEAIEEKNQANGTDSSMQLVYDVSLKMLIGKLRCIKELLNR